jgi:hypothetical protein
MGFGRDAVGSIVIGDIDSRVGRPFGDAYNRGVQPKSFKLEYDF